MEQLIHKQKKIYESPNLEVQKVILSRDVLTDSHPGGGSWGYFDDETNPTYATQDPTDDFDW